MAEVPEGAAVEPEEATTTDSTGMMDMMRDVGGTGMAEVETITAVTGMEAIIPKGMTIKAAAGQRGTLTDSEGVTEGATTTTAGVAAETATAAFADRNVPGICT